MHNELTKIDLQKMQEELNYRRMFMQGRAFGKMHWKKMNTAQKAVLRAFLSLPEQTPAQRLRTIAAYGFYKTSPAQTAAQCFTIPHFKYRQITTVKNGET